MRRGLDDWTDCHPRQSVDDIIGYMDRDLEVLRQRSVLCVCFPNLRQVTMWLYVTYVTQ